MPYLSSFGLDIRSLGATLGLPILNLLILPALKVLLLDGLSVSFDFGDIESLITRSKCKLKHLTVASGVVHRPYSFTCLDPLIRALPSSLRQLEVPAATATFSYFIFKDIPEGSLLPNLEVPQIAITSAQELEWFSNMVERRWGNPTGTISNIHTATARMSYYLGREFNSMVSYRCDVLQAKYPAHERRILSRFHVCYSPFHCF